MLFWRLIKKWHCIRTLKRNLHCLYIFYKAYNLFVFPLGSPKLNFFFEQFQRCSIFIMLSFLSHSKYVRFELFLFAITSFFFFSCYFPFFPILFRVCFHCILAFMSYCLIVSCYQNVWAVLLFYCFIL